MQTFFGSSGKPPLRTPAYMKGFFRRPITGRFLRDLEKRPFTTRCTAFRLLFCQTFAIRELNALQREAIYSNLWRRRLILLSISQLDVVNPCFELQAMMIMIMPAMMMAMIMIMTMVMTDGNDNGDNILTK